MISELPFFNDISISGLGQKFAILEMKAVASKVLNNFEISLADDSLSDPVLIGNLITTTVDPIHYHIKRRMD